MAEQTLNKGKNDDLVELDELFDRLCHWVCGRVRDLQAQLVDA